MMTSNTDRASFSNSSTALLAIPYSVTPGESRNFDIATSSYNVSNAATKDPAYLFNQERSLKWIRQHGLEKQKLTFDQILQQVGFKRVESFDPAVGKTITAKYAGNLYHEVQQDNGDRYVLTCRPEKLREYHHRLLRMLNLLRKRILFLTDGSRRVFGIIGDSSVCLICDCKTSDHRIFNQYQMSLTSLLKEQISRIEKFNIIWVSNDNQPFREQPVAATPSNIDQAIDWICAKKCSHDKISISATCEAVLNGFNYAVESVYLISEGESSDSAREMLRDNLIKSRSSIKVTRPLHVISLFCNNDDTQTFLHSIAELTRGSFFSYKIKSETPDLKASLNLYDPTRIKLQENKLQMGTNALAPVPKYPLDIALMYREMFECQNIIDRIEKILGFIRSENQSPAKTAESTKSLDAFNVSGDHNFHQSMVVHSSALFRDEEKDMTSADWLKSNGIDAQKLDFFSILHSAAFRHCDGVVKLLKPPAISDEDTAGAPANPEDKLVNAIYCDEFAHVTWPDGTIRHVHVTPELYRDYDKRIRALMEKLKARLSWLKKGSRDVFGSILENNIYILIDTSQSMQHHLNFVKDKLRLLVQDQLRTKERINMVAFNSVVNPWRDRLTKINEATIYSQLEQWINGLQAEGSTNTLAAIRFALADSATEAIYLLTDGRPDQKERHILSQVQYRQTVAIHTIAFNCNDVSANQFLYELAKQTGGRFHAFNYGFDKQTSIEIPESEDVSSLKQELSRAEKELQRIAGLRDECMGRAWSKEDRTSKASKSGRRSTSTIEALSTAQFNSSSAHHIPSRPQSATMHSRKVKRKRSAIRRSHSQVSRSATQTVQHSNVISINEKQWLLPETKEYLGIRNGQEKPESDTEIKREVETAPAKKKQPSSPYNEVIAYLKKNSLVRKGLTIFDVLHPTSVTIRDPHHIQVIDRYVLAKVWDDILPLAYGSYVGRLRLVNHYAVNLVQYETDLKEIIVNYHEFTAKFIWKYLSDEQKRSLASSLYWNRLSKDEQNKISGEIDQKDYTSKSALENFAWRKLTDQEQNEELEKPPSYHGDSQKLLKQQLKDAGADSALQGVARMDVEIHRAIKFLQISADLRQLQKPSEEQPKTDPPTKTDKKSSAGRHPRQRFICRFDANGYFYSGTIRKHADGRSIMHFDMGVEQEAVGHILLPTSGAIAQPPIFVEDYVLVRQLKDTVEYWVPGIVLVLPSPIAKSTPLYTVQIHHPYPRRVDVSRRDILKISIGVFQRTVLYIQSLHHKTTPAVEVKKGSIIKDFETVIRKELEPVTSRIESFHRFHDERYVHLQNELKNQTVIINQLQEKMPKPRARPTEDQSTEITLKPPVVPPKTTTRPTTPHEIIPLTPPLINPSPKPPEEIPTGTHVYALWKDDDSFAHESIIMNKQDGSNAYCVSRVDLPNAETIVLRENIFLQSNLKRLKTLKPKQCLLIEYPKSGRGTLKPAIILESDKISTKTPIRLYDCTPADASNNEDVIPITNEQFEAYTELRIQYEKSLVNQVVVGFNTKKKVFMLGTIIERKKSGHTYLIQWCDNKTDDEEEENLFGAFTRQVQHHPNDFVLALDKDQHTFQPARVIKVASDKKTVTVQFIDAEETNKPVDVAAETTFVLAESHYNSIIENNDA